MRALSKEAEQKLLGAIERAATLVNEGASPNDAIIKSASAANIPAGHINLMVHAYNTGRTNKQRELGADTLEKAADFQLADADVVMEALYPKQVKTSAELKQTSIISTEYAVSPTGFIARRQEQLRKSAAARAMIPAPEYVPPPRDEHSAARRLYSQKQAEKRAAEEVRRQATVAHAKAAAAMDELAQYFRVPGNMSFNDAVREVGLRLGPTGVSVLQKVAAVYPQLEKQAATKQDYFGNLPVVTLVENVISSVSSFNDAQNKLAAQTPAPVEKKAAPEPVTGSILHDPRTAPLALKVANVVKKKPDSAPPLTSYSGTMGHLGKLMSPGGMSSEMNANEEASTNPEKQKRKAFMSMSDADHENKLQQIKSRGVLNDLILNDPVISGYDPHEIASAYNQIAEIAPNFTGSSAAMQALLRKRLEAGQLADFDVKQLIEMEKLRAESLKSNLEAQEKARGLL
ncbi:hypothetical protein EBZ80_16450 [bacterium]|nr:hypothetical protein [Betaproteobacteria bacterium]NDE16514.1 hypothetical protein [bacterium]